MEILVSVFPELRRYSSYPSRKRAFCILVLSRLLVPEVRRVEAAQEALALCDDALRDDLEPLKTGPSPPMRIDFVDCWNWGWFCQRDSRGYLRMGFQGKRRTNGRNLGR
jgi:hypothetical protein